MSILGATKLNTFYNKFKHLVIKILEVFVESKKLIIPKLKINMMKYI